MELCQEVYRLSATFPKDELYGLTSQIRRSAVSVPSNIAEGQARNTQKEFIHFLNVSYGSLAELETQLIISVQVDYTRQDNIALILSKIQEIGRMIKSLIRSLEKSRPQPLALTTKN